MLPLRAVKEEMRMTTRSWPPTQGRGMAVGPGGMSSTLRQVITEFSFSRSGKVAEIEGTVNSVIVDYIFVVSFKNPGQPVHTPIHKNQEV